MADNNHLQNAFLKTLRQDKIAVSIFLISGIKLHGVVEDYDEHVILLKNAVTQMVFKNAISTVVPSQAISVSSASK